MPSGLLLIIRFIPFNMNRSRRNPLLLIALANIVKQIKHSIFALAKRNTQSEKSSEHADTTEKTTNKSFIIFTS